MTNTAPYFTVPSFPVFLSSFNIVSSIQILDIRDNESNPIILSAELLVSGILYPLPSYLSITGSTIYSAPTLIADIGLHTLRLKISDGGGLFSTMDMALNVTNTPPYFTSNPLNYSVKINNTLSFSLPPKKDD